MKFSARGITIKPKIGVLILQGLPISASEEETVREVIASLKIMERFWLRRPKYTLKGEGWADILDGTAR